MTQFFKPMGDEFKVPMLAGTGSDISLHDFVKIGTNGVEEADASTDEFFGVNLSAAPSAGDRIIVGVFRLWKGTAASARILRTAI